MARKTWAETRAENEKARKKRWQEGKTNLQKAALFIKKKTGWTSKNKGLLSSAIGAAGENVEKKRKTTKDKAWAKKTKTSAAAKAGFTDAERIARKNKVEDFRANRKRMDKLRRGTAEQRAEYKRIKKKQRKDANLARFERKGVNPNDY